MFTLKSGNWNDTTTWSCGRIPTNSDVVIIKSSHLISIPANITVNAKDVIYEGGTINPLSGASLCIGCQ